MKRYVGALRLITRRRYDMVAELATTYPEIALYVPALVDFTHTARDAPATSVRGRSAFTRWWPVKFGKRGLSPLYSNLTGLQFPIHVTLGWRIIILPDPCGTTSAISPRRSE